jgi:polyhydroxyalkanoate synthesis regulator phasin
MIKWNDVRTRGGTVFDSCPYIDAVIDFLKGLEASEDMIKNMEYIRAIAKELRSDFSKGEDKVYELEKRMKDMNEELGKRGEETWELENQVRHLERKIKELENNA